MLLGEKNRGFTLVELTISMVIGLIIIILVTTSFGLAQKTFRKSNIRAELTQNGRVTLDLMSRELRQAKTIVTALPENDSNPETMAHEIQFEDGHITSQIQYIRYYLAGNSLYRQTIAYCFETDCPNYVHWNDVDAFGPPDLQILDADPAGKIIGENFSGLNFYGLDSITIDLNLQKSGEEVGIRAVINPRNI
ncbi:MAG: hypothetical protein A3J65_04760 [Candidatus Buchananbacteria bacterium RIFCSPHIGHO2_02_FULL_45_11b]|uniref:Prepilin-type N-terminal cleavage/methylation domain-containing protein n=4 Tax=Candidatus Buchananiibacteriota TaxID=1817903 RepID=A0A1G1Y6Q9_9BACT|nr:MAG: hypothetical protein A2663_02655 [Candidatus Buchananbacteria bacterium RIFCSPHIGHO2_01_FULL_46_12]OGY52665.1 MAG: hypothetical protein A3J65_04760 [Candidatus Buchananbacteria bacterium RIFCSPHIGHO2_02_FULL_45_11b]OGY52771.1 MAG: hypothetical protein A3B15_03565 [Candidatus Buchananbacteria bacterium RIFCSPLOWO2_01_FULL_45_31]OGY58261.1 MAG: hypothetical protein A3H67_04045 [Candidatus Buchananbacteria bacterium RIFCSPLOWO2_02_FULL_46_11b]